MRKPIIFISILLLIVIISSCASTPISHLVLQKNDFIDYENICKILDKFLLSDGNYQRYTSGWTVKLYPTYYSILTKRCLGVEYEIPTYPAHNDFVTLKSHAEYSLNDVYYLCDMYSRGDVGGITKDELYDYVLSYKSGDSFYTYYDSIGDPKWESDADAMLFGFYQAAMCFDLIDADIDKSISEATRTWLKQYTEILMNDSYETLSEISGLMGNISMIFTINEIIGEDSTSVLSFADKYYDRYVEFIIQGIDNKEPMILIPINTYWFIADILQKDDILMSKDLSDFVEMFFPVSNDYESSPIITNSMTMYMAVVFAQKYKYDISTEDIIRIIDRYESSEHFYCEYVIQGSNLMNTFQVTKIHNLLSDADIIYEGDTDFFKISIGNGALSEDEIAFVNSKIESYSDLSLEKLENTSIKGFAMISHRMDCFKDNSELKKQIETLIQHLSDKYESLSVKQRIILCNALQIYEELWGTDRFKSSIEKIRDNSPSSLEECYHFTRLLEVCYSESFINYITQDVYNSITLVIEKAYDEDAGLFSSEPSSMVSDYEPTYWGVYLSKRYFL